MCVRVNQVKYSGNKRGMRIVEGGWKRCGGEVIWGRSV